MKRPSDPPAVERRRWHELARLLDPDIDPAALRLMEEMRLVAQSLRRMAKSSLVASGLSYAQYRILMSLLLARHFDEHDQLNPSEISQLQGTSRNTISALIRSLENDGLIERRLDQSDRRRFNISLTPAGHELVKRHARHHTAIIGHCFGALSDSEQTTLSRLLRKLGEASRRLEHEHQPHDPAGEAPASAEAS